LKEDIGVTCEALLTTASQNNVSFSTTSTQSKIVVGVLKTYVERRERSRRRIEENEI
jgi:hypothetical protein